MSVNVTVAKQSLLAHVGYHDSIGDRDMLLMLVSVFYLLCFCVCLFTDAL